MDNKGQIMIDWLILLGLILIMVSVVLYLIEENSKININQDVHNTRTIKDKIYKL